MGYLILSFETIIEAKWYQLTEKLFTLFRKYCLEKIPISLLVIEDPCYMYMYRLIIQVLWYLYIYSPFVMQYFFMPCSFMNTSLLYRIDFWERNLKEYMLHCLNVTVWKPHWLGWYSYLNSSIQGMCIL